MEDVFQKVYAPSFIPESSSLSRGGDESKQPRTLEEIQQDMAEQLSAFHSQIQEQGIGSVEYREPRPLTIEEAKEVIKEKQKIVQHMKRVASKADKLDNYIDETLTSPGKSFVYSFKEKPRLKKAIRVVLGKNKQSITYEDYKKALDIKTEMETEEAQSFFTDDEKESFEIK